jgi:hypothetical protein
MRHFLQGAAAWPGVAQALSKFENTSEQFVEKLLEKCHGLWIYLNFVVHEIDSGEHTSLDINNLPDGLQEYYAYYWSKWRKKADWYNLYLPILTTLAAAQEAIAFERLFDWAEITMHPAQISRLKSIIKEIWRPFLSISEKSEKELYRFNHDTIQEFFDGAGI